MRTHHLTALKTNNVASVITTGPKSGLLNMVIFKTNLQRQLDSLRLTLAHTPAVHSKRGVQRAHPLEEIATEDKKTYILERCLQAQKLLKNIFSVFSPVKGSMIYFFILNFIRRL